MRLAPGRQTRIMSRITCSSLAIPNRFHTGFSISLTYSTRWDAFSSRRWMNMRTTPIAWSLPKQVKSLCPVRPHFLAYAIPMIPPRESSADHLVRPLSADLAEKVNDWEFQTLLGAEATKRQLGQLLGGDEHPALLFTASHGYGFPQW